VVTAERPAAPIEKGRPGPGLLAQVVTAKYADHLPLNRQAEIFARHGVPLARQTLCDWVAAAADLLTPLYEDLKAHVLTSHAGGGAPLFGAQFEKTSTMNARRAVT
jgi:transposase